MLEPELPKLSDTELARLDAEFGAQLDAAIATMPRWERDYDLCRELLHGREMLARIDCGSAGEVWLIKDKQTSEFQVAKLVWSNRPIIKEWFFEQERAAVELLSRTGSRHPNLIPILHSGAPANPPLLFYVMPAADDALLARNIDPTKYAPCTLWTKLQASRAPDFVPLDTIKEWMGGVAQGVEALHRDGLLHRDLKLGNVLFVRGKPVVADIGLLISAAEARSIDAVEIGTAGYIPPESKRTFASDVYALGKICYELMTGLDRKQFPALPSSILDRPEADRWRALNKLVLAACDRNPSGRPGDAGRFLDQLGAI